MGPEIAREHIPELSDLPESDDGGGEHDLLLAALALHNAFVDWDDLVVALRAWSADRSRPLGRVLVDHGAMDADGLALVEALAGVRRRADAGEGLSAVGELDSLRRALRRIAGSAGGGGRPLAADWHGGGESEATGFADLLRPDDDPNREGSHLAAGSRYRILRHLARGGLGEVYVARDEELHREVALKEIRGPDADRARSRARFLREAEITGGLEHPGIVPVYGLGYHADGRPFYAMRLIRGEGLDQVIDRFHADAAKPGPPNERALELRRLLGRFLVVCHAVEYAHSKGVLHRDLKPGNIMLGTFGETLVVDWGLAKELGASPRAEPADGSRSPAPRPGSGPETQPGSMCGTPGFMSPEQAAGELDRLGPPGDVYSLGATLHCLLTGRVPGEGADAGRGDRPIPRALLAVCRKAMATAPADRYASARALAEDVERWLADEPVSAWHEPVWTKARRRVARHRVLVAAAGAGVLVALLAAVGFAAYRQARAEGLVVALEAAETRAVPDLLDQLGGDRRLVRGRLRAMALAGGDGPDAGRRRLHAALALLPDEPSWRDALRDHLLRSDTRPDELIVIRRALDRHGHAPPLSPALFAVLDRGDAVLADDQLHAAAALARFAPRDPRWRPIAGPLAARLVRENPLLLGGWGEAFEPVAALLTEALRAHHGGVGPPPERALAFDLLVAFATRPGNPARPEDLAALVPDASAAQFAALRGRLAGPADRARAGRRLAQRLDPPARADEAMARRQGRVAAALAALGHPEAVWPLLRQGDDPGLRTEVLHDLAPFGVDPRLVIDRLDVEPDVSARRALILALGEFPPAGVAPDDRRRVLEALSAAHGAEGDPGLHSAIEWLWQRWHGPDPGPPGRAPSGTGPDAARDWFVTAEGHTMAVVRGPAEFRMGDPDGEADEAPRRVRIGHAFALATREVTVAQYARFLDDDPDRLRLDRDERLRAYLPSADCPIVAVDWYDAARYCNWLSRREGIAEGQWCYPEPIGPGMALAPDLLDRTGYRLPTEAEWEYACRAGSTTSRPFGGSEARLGQYGWALDHADRHAHPTGRLKPNDLGLFDMLGNAIELTQDLYLAADAEGGGAQAAPEAARRVGRGGSYILPASMTRSAVRFPYRPEERDLTTGFRPARTMPPDR